MYYKKNVLMSTPVFVIQGMLLVKRFQYTCCCLGIMSHVSVRVFLVVYCMTIGMLPVSSCNVSKMHA